MGFNLPVNVGFGVSSVNGKLLTTMNASFAYVFHTKTSAKILLGLSETGYYNIDTDKPFNLQTNSFTDIFVNFKMADHPFLYATNMKISVGYLTRRQGDLFPKNTWRLNYQFALSKGLNLEYTTFFLAKNRKTDILGLALSIIFSEIPQNEILFVNRSPVEPDGLLQSGMQAQRHRADACHAFNQLLFFFGVVFRGEIKFHNHF